MVLLSKRYPVLYFIHRRGSLNDYCETLVVLNDRMMCNYARYASKRVLEERSNQS